jgi:ATP-binding cassette subfamily A (ABC1) protein 3
MFIPMLSLLTENVRERQYKMKDLLEISGLMNVSYWFSYLFVIVGINQLTIWFSVGILTALNILTDAHAMPYVGLMTVYCIGLACFSLFGGFLVNRSEYYGLPVFLVNTALTVAGAFLTLEYEVSVSAKLFLCFLHPSIAFTFGTFSIETYLHHHSGAAMDANFTDHAKNYPSLNACIGVMIASSIVYLFLSIGMPFEWLQTRLLATSDFALVAFVTDREADVKYPCDDEAAEERKKGIKTVSAVRNLLKVKGLSHVYPDGTNAVKDISFNIKEGEVLSFLGANGAGKSTCMGMLCGTLEATFGDALVNGYSISNDKTRARRNLGIAMQQDIIWDDVSVEDHLYLFGSLRGMFGAKLRADVDAMVESLGFPEKRKSMAGTLSGGQKRRLCVGISMVGGNSVVYLDEPTAGLDPVSRRQLWDLVQKNRAGRAILLTTHFMDEADVLGDRIAIVKEGRLRALGTSKFLKQRFGLGYQLKMSLTEGADVKLIVARVATFVPEVSTASNAGTELSLRLPKETVSQFPTLFEALESESKSLGVLSYGIETTTLEEVFMRIVNEDTEQLISNHEEANRLLTASATERDDNAKLLQKRDESRNPLKKNQIKALLVKGTPDNIIQNQVAIMVQKRFHQFTRSRGQWALGLVCPLVMAILACSMIKGMPNSIVGGDNDVMVPAFSSPYATPLSGPASQEETQALFEKAFGADQGVKYLGQTFNQLDSYVSNIATSGKGATSTAGIYYESVSNFTVMYNASYPVNFAGAVSNMLNAATLDVTGNKLVATNTYQTLPGITLFGQIFDGILVAMLIALFAGAIGAGMSIVVGGERTQLVKHQQLASGASKLAYWIANFVFDFGLMFLLCVLFTIILSAFSPADYNTPGGFSAIVGASIPFSIVSVFRFYVVSFFVDDVRMAQTIYFYGSLFTMFALLVVFIITTFNSNHGDVSSPAIQALAVPWTLIDPSFGWFLIILFQHNFLGE